MGLASGLCCGYISKPFSGSHQRVQAWGLRRLVSVFARAARRPHIPREPWMRKLYVEADIELPEGSTFKIF